MRSGQLRFAVKAKASFKFDQACFIWRKKKPAGTFFSNSLRPPDLKNRLTTRRRILTDSYQPGTKTHSTRKKNSAKFGVADRVNRLDRRRHRRNRRSLPTKTKGGLSQALLRRLMSAWHRFAGLTILNFQTPEGQNARSCLYLRQRQTLILCGKRTERERSIYSPLRSTRAGKTVDKSHETSLKRFLGKIIKLSQGLWFI